MLMKYSDCQVVTLESSIGTLPDQLGMKYAHVIEAINPNFIYSVVRGIEGDVFNENWDYWPWRSELLTKKAHGPHLGQWTWETWRNKPNCVGHINRGPQDHYGKVADCWPNHKEQMIDMVIATDRNLNSRLCDDIEAGVMSTVSMGCGVGYSVCSKCAHIAYTPKDYCDCVKWEKGRLIPYKEAQKVASLRQGMPFIGAVDRDYLRVGEICYDSNGVEMSWVPNPAFPHCTSKGVLAAPQNQKVSEYRSLAGALAYSPNPRMQRAANVLAKLASKSNITPQEDKAAIELLRALKLR
jgi:hypothetical protein